MGHPFLAEVSSVKEIRLYFDPNLDREIPSLRPERWAPFHRIYPQVKVPKELVKSYGIFAWVGESGNSSLMRKRTSSASMCTGFPQSRLIGSGLSFTEPTGPDVCGSLK